MFLAMSWDALEQQESQVEARSVKCSSDRAQVDSRVDGVHDALHYGRDGQGCTETAHIHIKRSVQEPEAKPPLHPHAQKGTIQPQHRPAATNRHLNRRQNRSRPPAAMHQALRSSPSQEKLHRNSPLDLGVQYRGDTHYPQHSRGHIATQSCLGCAATRGGEGQQSGWGQSQCAKS
jgi:hypothetical protein